MSSKCLLAVPKQPYPVFALKRLKKHNQVRLLTSANHLTALCLSAVYQNKGLKLLLIFVTLNTNHKPQPSTANH